MLTINQTLNLLKDCIQRVENLRVSLETKRANPNVMRNETNAFYMHVSKNSDAVENSLVELHKYTNNGTFPIYIQGKMTKELSRIDRELYGNTTFYRDTQLIDFGVVLRHLNVFDLYAKTLHKYFETLGCRNDY